MPVMPLEIMISKIWSMGIVVFFAALLSLLFVVQGLLGVPIEGSVTLFMAGAILQLLATTAMGVAMATVVGSMPQFGLLLILILLPLQVLSGGMTPRESMPEIIQTLMLAAPNRECQKFRVRACIMGTKEITHGTTKRADYPR